MVSDPILLLLLVDALALLMLGLIAAALPVGLPGLLATLLCGRGALLALPRLIFGLAPTTLTPPIGPPGLSLHLALDPLSGFFLCIVLVAATAIAAFQSSAAPLAPAAPPQITMVCAAGLVLSLLAADAVVLALGLGIVCASAGRGRRALMAVPLLALGAVYLLTPAGADSGFEAIRANAPAAGHAAAATTGTLVAAGLLAWPWRNGRCWTTDALTAAVVLPLALYLPLRLVADLGGSAPAGGWGFVLLLAGGIGAIHQGWGSAAEADIDTIAGCLTRRQAASGVAGIGLALLGRSADLPGAATFALDAVALCVVAGAWAGTLLTLSAHAIGSGAGTYRLSRLGGLIALMPLTSAALSAGVLALSALPPSVGFAGLWLLLQALLSAPRTGGLLAQVPLALLAACLALSAALATAASIRLIGVALLGQPRTPRGSSAQESKSPVRMVLAVLAGMALLAGILPNWLLWILGEPMVKGLAEPAVRSLTGLPVSLPLGPSWLSIAGVMPGYLPVPVLCLLGLATAVTLLARRRTGMEAKPGGVWTGGMPPPIGLPFGDPGAQSAGSGFLPALPYSEHGGIRQGQSAAPTNQANPGGRRAIAVTWQSCLATLTGLAASAERLARSPATGLWLILAAFGILLLAMAVGG